MQLSYRRGQRRHVIIKYMEKDKDNIHSMIETEPATPVCGYPSIAAKALSVWKWIYKASSENNVKSDFYNGMI